MFRPPPPGALAEAVAKASEEALRAKSEADEARRAGFRVFGFGALGCRVFLGALGFSGLGFRVWGFRV